MHDRSRIGVGIVALALVSSCGGRSLDTDGGDNPGVGGRLPGFGGLGGLPTGGQSGAIGAGGLGGRGGVGGIGGIGATGGAAGRGGIGGQRPAAAPAGSAAGAAPVAAAQRVAPAAGAARRHRGDRRPGRHRRHRRNRRHRRPRRHGRHRRHGRLSGRGGVRRRRRTPAAGAARGGIGGIGGSGGVSDGWQRRRRRIAAAPGSAAPAAPSAHLPDDDPADLRPGTSSTAPRETSSTPASPATPTRTRTRSWSSTRRRRRSVSAIPVGSNPGALALSDDGSTLWVGIDGAHAFRKVTMTSTPPVVGPLIHLPKRESRRLLRRDLDGRAGRRAAVGGDGAVRRPYYTRTRSACSTTACARATRVTGTSTASFLTAGPPGIVVRRPRLSRLLLRVHGLAVGHHADDAHGAAPRLPEQHRLRRRPGVSPAAAT